MDESNTLSMEEKKIVKGGVHHPYCPWMPGYCIDPKYMSDINCPPWCSKNMDQL
ncbi:MAG: hypothetical protein LBG19_13395 [Prevotellaceae bacterium]|nr:hypothetical protein [Prevotellaceae bacterium]